MGDEELKTFLGGIKGHIGRTVVEVPAQQAYVQRYSGRLDAGARLA